MNFLDAKSKLKKIAAGRYHYLLYEVGEYCDGSQKQRCSCYIDPSLLEGADTWEKALELIDLALNSPDERSKLDDIEIESIEELDNEN